MTTYPKVSVVVPAYRRPDFMRKLIDSYLVQDYKDSELVIVDDSMDDNRVEEVVKAYSLKDARVRLIKNETNLGFCKNLIKSIVSGRGQYILILGDDDMFVDEKAVSAYVKNFEADPDLAFIYSNQIQFNNDYAADYVYTHFAESKTYEAGKDSFDNTWLLSCFISGIGLRKRSDFSELYPKDNILFPQVEMVGKILLSKKSRGLNDYLIGSRAHNEQLGFKAVKGKDIKNDEKHSAYELRMILDRIREYGQSKSINMNTIGYNIVDTFFENKHLTIFPGEKINTGNRAILKIFMRAVQNNPKALLNLRFMFYFLVSFLTPRGLLIKIKDWKKSQFMKSHEKQRDIFNNFIKTII